MFKWRVQGSEAECCTYYAMPRLTLKVYCTNLILAESEHVDIQFKVQNYTRVMEQHSGAHSESILYCINYMQKQRPAGIRFLPFEIG